MTQQPTQPALMSEEALAEAEAAEKRYFVRWGGKYTRVASLEDLWMQLYKIDDALEADEYTAVQMDVDVDKGTHDRLFLFRPIVPQEEAEPMPCGHPAACMGEEDKCEACADAIGVQDRAAAYYGEQIQGWMDLYNKAVYKIQELEQRAQGAEDEVAWFKFIVRDIVEGLTIARKKGLELDLPDLHSRLFEIAKGKARYGDGSLSWEPIEALATPPGSDGVGEDTTLS